MEPVCGAASIVGGASGVLLLLIKCIYRTNFKSKCSESGVSIELDNPAE